MSASSPEPRWRVLLCWGVVVCYLTLPLTVFVVVLVSEHVNWLNVDEHLKHYKWVGPFFQSVTALVFGLAGLNTADRFVLGKRNNGVDSKSIKEPE